MADALTSSVVKILLSENIKKIKAFQLGGNMIAPAHFYLLATKIHFYGTLTINYSSKQKSPGQYKSGKNEIWFYFPKAESETEVGVVIHEAVHAILDMTKASISNGDGETLAYVAQCQYVRAMNPGADRIKILDHEGNLITDRDDVFKYGWDIAGILLGGGTPFPEDYRRLREAVSRHPNYSEDHSLQAVNDGI